MKLANDIVPFLNVLVWPGAHLRSQWATPLVFGERGTTTFLVSLIQLVLSEECGREKVTPPPWAFPKGFFPICAKLIKHWDMKWHEVIVNWVSHRP